MGLFGLTFVKDKEFAQLREDITRYQRELEDIGWVNLSQDLNGQYEFIIGSFRQMLRRCRLLYYNDPLAGQWVNLTTAFVYGEGVSKPTAKDKKIQALVDEFWDDPDNRAAMTSMIAQQLLSNKIQVEGNIFFALFDDEMGKVKARILNTEEIDDVIRDPEDRLRPLFYKTKMVNREFNYASDAYTIDNKGFVYYPDVENYDPNAYGVPANKLVDGCRVMHFKVNCDINDKFGVPDLYRGLDWMKAHKTMCEDVATLVKALSDVAWKKKVKGGPAVVANIQSAMNSKTNFSNIKNTAGKTQVENDGIDLSAIKIETGGVSIGKDGARMAKLMVCAASGIFEHYFGDPSTGNLATAKTMELPMVKKFVIYQALWRSVHLQIFNYIIDRKIEAGLLNGKVVDDPKNKRKIYEYSGDRTIEIDFPPILQEDLKIWAEALNMGVDGDLISEDTAARLFIMSANVNDVDAELELIKQQREDKAAKAAALTIVDPANGRLKDNPAAAAPGTNTPAVPVKEAVADTKSRLDLRHAKKTNYTMQRMNGYRKTLNGHFKELLETTKGSLKVYKHEDKYVAHAPDYGNALHKFTQKMQESAKQYFPVAIQIGSKYIQSVLKDVKEGYEPSISLFEANNQQQSLLADRLQWNSTYLNDSLEPDMHTAFDKATRDQYDTEEAATAAITDSITKFAGRVEQYVGAFWTVEERAVKEAGGGSGVMVEFVGPDDDHTCDGCDEAVNGGPYAIDDAPVPGEQDCLGRCRHALQVVTGDDSAAATE